MPRSPLNLQNPSPDGNADHEEYQAHHEKEKEQELCDSCCSRRYAGKSEQRGDERDYEKNHCPT
jgi:hypothetical protein